MKKIFYLFSIILFSVLSFSSCSDDDDDTNVTAGKIALTSTDESVKINEQDNTAEVTLAPLGSSATLTIQSDVEWKIEEDSDGNWCSVTRENNTLTFSANEFVSDYVRTTLVKIVSDYSSSFLIKVSQAGTEAATLTLTPESVLFIETGGSETISVITNKNEWEVTGYEDANWLTVEKFDTYFTVSAGQSVHTEDVTLPLTVTAGRGENTISRVVEIKQEKKSPAFITISQSKVTLPPKGGNAQIEVSSNRVWKAETTNNWIDLTYDENYIYLSTSSSAMANQGTITISAGEGDDVSMENISVRQVVTDPFIVEVYMQNPGDAMILFGAGDIDCYVDWGDGTGNSYQTYLSPYETKDDLRHIYQNAGTYYMAVYGTVSHIHWPMGQYLQERQSLKKVTQWGELDVTDMNNAFYATGITELAEGAGKMLSRVTDFSGCFQFCSALRSIPADLFSSSSVATNFTGTFFGCSSLTTLPEGLFENCPVTEAPSLFRECYALVSVPENLLDTFTEVENVGGLFQDCISLQSVPVSLFDNCRKINSAWGVFENCEKLTGESPYTIIENTKVHLYERNNYPDFFATIYSYWNCFTNCNLLEDYELIPADWKE